MPQVNDIANYSKLPENRIRWLHVLLKNIYEIKL